MPKIFKTNLIKNKTLSNATYIGSQIFIKSPADFIFASVL